jgi:hypothetical protein
MENEDLKTYYIYKICHKDKLINSNYIGSTIDFERRVKQHKSRFFNPLDNEYNKKIYVEIRKNEGIENYDFEIIEEIPNCSKINARIREEYYRQELKANTNEFKAYTSPELMNSNMKHYYKNKDFYLEKIDCPCGVTVCRTGLKKHYRSSSHHSYMENIDKNTVSIISPPI